VSSIQIVQMSVAELVIAEEPVVISTILGSCVSVCLYCPTSKIGGMNHFTLPSEQYARKNFDPNGRDLSDQMNFGSTSIPILIDEFCKRTNAPCTSIQAKIVGGASVVEQLKQSSEIGALNIAIAKEILREYGIKVFGSDVGGKVGRKVQFYTSTGRLRVALVSGPEVATSNSRPNILSRKLLAPEPLFGAAPVKQTVVSSGRRKRVLIVDDSKTIRTLLTQVFSQDPQLEVIGAACDAFEAEVLISKLRPDVMTLDVHMPKMDGVTFLEKLLPRVRLPVVMITALSIEESGSVLRALELGAVDYIQKPKLEDIASLGPVICERVRTAASARVKVKGQRGTAQKSAPVLGTRNRSIIIAIGASTGGTEALKDVLVNLPADIPPIVIVQHIPAVFSLAFATRLNQLCAFEVKEAAHGDLLKPGLVLIAPGGSQMAIAPSSRGYQVIITDDPPVNRHKPSVDYLFDSVAAHIGKKALGAILTGMGDDGSKGLLKMKLAGARTLAQDEASCVVYGMPKVAVEVGAVDEVHSLEKIAGVLVKWWVEEKAA
jgi:two-component system chemotaxis response regulator CheB